MLLASDGSLALVALVAAALICLCYGLYCWIWGGSH
jgi:hypothetical protein